MASETMGEQFGFEKTKEMCEINLTAPLQTARVNLTKITRDEVVSDLKEEGYNLNKSIIPEAIKCYKGKSSSYECF